MASNAGWTKTLPSGQSKVSNADEEFRSVKSFMEAWWEQEHYATSGSASSAGIAKHGAGRAFVGASSQLSNPTRDNDGRFLWATDVSRLYIAQASSSSWSLASENVQTTSQQSWTAAQEFADIARTGIFSGITSTYTVLAADQGWAADETKTFQMLNPGGTRFHRGDTMIVSFSSHIGVEFWLPHVRHASSSDSLNVVVHNTHASSRLTFPSGTTVSVVGFRLNTIP